MPIFLLLLLALACLPVHWPPALGATTATARLASISSGLTWLLVAGLAGLAALLSWQTRRLLARWPLDREAVLCRYSLYRTGYLAVLFLGYLAALAGLGWGWTVRYLCTPLGAEEMVPGAELLTVAPFLAGLILSWALFYDAERALHDSRYRGPLLAPAGSGLPPSTLGLVRRPDESQPFWSRWAYVGFHLRHHLALLLAPLLLVIGQGLLRQFGTWDNDWHYPLAALGLVIVVFLIMPWILRLALGLRSLPAGPLRERLQAVADRQRFRCSDFLLWHTRSSVANALVVGVLPRLRYVVFTDRLLSDLGPAEAEAVLGHEIGHVKHHHMLYYLVFMVVSLAVVAGTWSLLCTAAVAAARSAFPALGPHLHADADWQLVPLVPFLAVYIFVVFGFLSRRCERQADLFGCRVVSCGRGDCAGHDGDPKPTSAGLCPTGIHTFTRALEKVGQLNGVDRSRPGWLQAWQHSTIARRVEFLHRLVADPSLEARFQRRVGLVKWGLILGLFALLVLFGMTQGWSTVLAY